MKSNKKFKTESKQLLDLMIHSIYSNSDVFLRELISNASDALDKRHFYALTDANYEYDKLAIQLEIDKENRKISIIDNGIGMNTEELDKNLGTIANSGTKQFIENLEKNENNIETIGQFGVGFYASFIVADKVSVLTKKPGDEAYLWESDGIDTYSVSSAQRDEVGTTITLHLRAGEDFDKFLEDYTIKSLVKKYSDYIKYPIQMEVQTEVPVMDEEGNPTEVTNTVVETETINSQIAIWKKEKRKVKKEEYNDFYKAKYFDFTDPLHVIHMKAEGTLNYDLLLYIPSNAANQFGMQLPNQGIDLYSKGVLIESNVEYLVDDSFNFIKGLVDTSDLNLNISREMLQQDNEVKKLAASIEERIKKDLLKLQKKDRETYNKIYEQYKTQLVYGIYNNYGTKKEVYQDLVQYVSSKTNEMTTFKEYVSNNPEQDVIYYVTGESIEKLNNLPKVIKAKEKEIDFLYFTSDIDEFAIQVLTQYAGKQFKSILLEDYATEEEKEQIKKAETENKDILTKIKDQISGLTDVKFASDLTDEPAHLTAVGPISLEMEKVLARNEESAHMKADKVLNINESHPVFKLIVENADNDEKVKQYAQFMYDQALILEGMEIEKPAEYIKTLTELIKK